RGEAQAPAPCAPADLERAPGPSGAQTAATPSSLGQRQTGRARPQAGLRGFSLDDRADPDDAQADGPAGPTGPARPLDSSSRSDSPLCGAQAEGVPTAGAGRPCPDR